jgi:hypothetical protein
VTLRWTPRNRRFGVLDALGLAGLLGLAVARWVPVAKLPFWGCTLRQATGWPCPGCGLTRAADRLAHGNIPWALQANPLGALAGMVFAVLAAWTVVHLAVGLPTPELELTDREARRGRWVLAVAVVLNYLFVILETRFPHVLHG